jgi:short-subunit dehydrogenase
VKGVCEGLRPELRGSGIELSLVYPGLVRTELAAGTKAGRGGAWIEPREVGDAIAACLESPRPEVFVPRNLAFLLRLYVALPVPGRLAMGRLFGVDRIATEADHAAREAYERRVATG